MAGLHPAPCPDLVGTFNIYIFDHSTYLDSWEERLTNSQAEEKADEIDISTVF